MITRRSALFGLGAALCAPAIIRTPGLLMPVRAVAALPQPPAFAPLKTEGVIVPFRDQLWIIPADVVSSLGNGSVERGTQVLDALVEQHRNNRNADILYIAKLKSRMFASS